jgi:hypothetical protein
MDRGVVDRALGALKSRVFLFHDIHAGPPVFFHTRWAMSYLRGPLTRKQVRELAAGKGTTSQPEDAETRRPRDEEVEELRDRGAERLEDEGKGAAAKRGDGEGVGLGIGLLSEPPTLPPAISLVFLPPTVAFEWALRTYEERAGRSVLAQDRQLVYVPQLLALGTVRMLDQKRDVNHQETVARLIRVSEEMVGVDWEEGPVVLSRDDLSMRSPGEGLFEAVPSALARSRELKSREKDFSDYLYYNISVTILHNPSLDLYGQVAESRRDFRVRCEEEARRQRDAEVKKAKTGMEKQMARVQQRLRREQRELAEDQDEVDARKRDELLSLGESAFNLLTRRRSSSMISRASRKRTMTRKAEADVEESKEAIEDLEEQLEDLKAQWEEQVEEINDRWAEVLEEVEEFTVKPRRTDVRVEFCGLAWVPTWRVALEDGRRIDLAAREMDVQGE